MHFQPVKGQAAVSSRNLGSRLVAAGLGSRSSCVLAGRVWLARLLRVARLWMLLRWVANFLGQTCRSTCWITRLLKTLLHLVQLLAVQGGPLFGGLGEALLETPLANASLI